jgi:hypothetical protein
MPRRADFARNAGTQGLIVFDYGQSHGGISFSSSTPWLT